LRKAGLDRLALLLLHECATANHWTDNKTSRKGSDIPIQSKWFLRVVNSIETAIRTQRKYLDRKGDARETMFHERAREARTRLFEIPLPGTKNETMRDLLRMVTPPDKKVPRLPGKKCRDCGWMFLLHCWRAEFVRLFLKGDRLGPKYYLFLLRGLAGRFGVLPSLDNLAQLADRAEAAYTIAKMREAKQLEREIHDILKKVRFFNGDEARKIIMLAVEPYRTMFAIAAMTGLRVGEVVGLQKADLDFDRRIIHVNRSAWYGRVQTGKSKASRAPVVMSEALASVLEEYLTTWRPNSEGFLFVNRNGRPYAANKVVEYGLWPVLDELKIPRCGMHAFRHCHASLLMDVGANPTVTKEQMRHSDAHRDLRACHRRQTTRSSGQSG
jgi:integrase